MMRLAIQHHGRRELFQPQFARDQFRQLIILLPVGIFRPSAEAPVGNRDFMISGLTPHEHRAGIAGPSSIRRPEMKFHPLEAYVATVEQGTNRVTFRGVADNDVNVLNAAQMADNVSIDPRNRLKFSRPVILIVRPGKPRALVPLPFSGHAIAEFAWSQLIERRMWIRHCQSRNLWLIPE